jgi:hypothetical protein
MSAALSSPEGNLLTPTSTCCLLHCQEVDQTAAEPLAQRSILCALRSSSEYPMPVLLFQMGYKKGDQCQGLRLLSISHFSASSTGRATRPVSMLRQGYSTYIPYQADVCLDPRLYYCRSVIRTKSGERISRWYDSLDELSDHLAVYEQVAYFDDIRLRFPSR